METGTYQCKEDQPCKVAGKSKGKEKGKEKAKGNKTETKANSGKPSGPPAAWPHKGGTVHDVEYPGKKRQQKRIRPKLGLKRVKRK